MLLVVILFLTAFSHTAIMSLRDNGNGTVTVDASLSTGETVQGATIVVRDKETNEPLSRETMPGSGKLVIRTPQVPYTVTLDMGEGHTVVRSGPVTVGPGVSNSGQPRMPTKHPGIPPWRRARLGVTLLFVGVALWIVLRRKKRRSK